MSTERFRVDPPRYEVVAREGPLELRTYAPRIVAVTEVGPESGKPREEAFMRLAGFIFGGNSRSQKLSMTSPVELDGGEQLATTSPVALEPGGGGVLRMSFFMSPEYGLEALPTPKDQRVRLERAPAHTVVALRFRGRVTERRVERKQEELLRRAREAGWTVEGEPWLAVYDGPGALPFLRRTEVLVRARDTVRH
jgi:hypothetical protein